MKGTVWIVGGLVVVGLATLIAINLTRNSVNNRPIAKSEPKPDLPQPVPTRQPPPTDYVNVGGVDRPKSDVEVPKSDKPIENFEMPDPGSVPLVGLEANDQVKSVSEAIASKDPKMAYRASVMLPAPEFNREQYESDPDKYLKEVAPGRIWQALPVGPGVEPIVRRGGYINEVLQGESVNLETQVKPGMPVTFFSPRLGQFENELSVISVRADENGIARATFKASSGTQGEIDIFATSPVHSHQARFLVNVILPAKASQAAREPDRSVGKSTDGGS